MGNEIVFSVLLKYLGFLIAITMYQAATAIMAKRRGDKSSETIAMATMNPFIHMEPIGTVILPLITIAFSTYGGQSSLISGIIIGWPKAYTISTRYFKNVKKDTNITYLAGIASCFIISLICMIAYHFLIQNISSPIILSSQPMDTSYILSLMVSSIGYQCMIFGALFLWPIPGFAGWNLLINNLSYNAAMKVQNQAQMIYIAAIIILMSGIANIYFYPFVLLYRYGMSL